MRESSRGENELDFCPGRGCEWACVMRRLGAKKADCGRGRSSGLVQAEMQAVAGDSRDLRVICRILSCSC